MYIFKNGEGKPLYVGKAGNLKSRLKSYFGNRLEGKTASMVAKAQKMEFIQTLSEVEALILESKLIKTLKPRYNRALKDDKSYQYIEITKEQFPKVSRVRKKKAQAVYFGPFPQGKAVFEICRLSRRIFKFRDCAATKFRRYSRLKRGCLYLDLGLCTAPCARQIGQKEYSQNIKNLKAFLSGQSSTVEKEWLRKIKEYQSKNRFERAARIKQQLEALNYIRRPTADPKEYLEDPNFYEDGRRKEYESLCEVLLPKEKAVKFEEFTIEGFDISNLAGTAAVGSKVSFLRGEPNKSKYRRYKIKTVSGISDVGMLEEVLQRRLTNKADEPRPHLILVDGGVTQVSKTKAVLDRLALTVPLVGLAKKKETLVYPEGNIFRKLRLPRNHPGLKLLQRVRDESHRFAITYHKKLRLQKFSQQVIIVL